MQLNEATVLIVDDEPFLLEVFRAWLVREGCRTVTADNGARGLQLAKEARFDLIISDIRMPVMTGIEMARQVSALDGYTPKIIFVSGFGDVTERECFDIGVECLLPKPSRRGDFLAAVRRSLTPRTELWQLAPPCRPETSLQAAFISMSHAMREGLFALGRGGFCARSDLATPAGQAIGFQLEFSVDQHVLAGQGLVRWTEPEISEIGVEIICVESACRAWIVGLSQRDEIKQFIPKQCRAESGP